MSSILLVEDEPAIADTLLYAMELEGFESKWCSTGEETLLSIKDQTPDLIILDVGLPDINGFELFRQIRKAHSTPIIFLTARSDEIDRVAGLEMGGDDYISKPFSPREVTARVRAVLRRSALNEKTTSETLFTIDKNKCQIKYNDSLLELSRYEYRILAMMITHPLRVYSRGEIMDLVWEEPDISGDRTVDTHIKKIRQKLKEVTVDYDPLKTHRGIGYSLRVERE